MAELKASMGGGGAAYITTPNLSLLRDLPRRASPLILDRTLGVNTPISVYTLLGSCAPLGFCALLSVYTGHEMGHYGLYLQPLGLNQSPY